MILPENQIQYVDRPDVHETFVDSLGVVSFDGVTRLELCVTRMDMTRPPDPPHAKRYPVCRGKKRDRYIICEKSFSHYSQTVDGRKYSKAHEGAEG